MSAASEPVTGERRADSSRRRVLVALVVLALCVRVVHLLHAAPSALFVFHDLFEESDMHMFDQWARRIAGGDLLSREPVPLYGWQRAAAPERDWERWGGPTGAFHKAPFYAYLLAGLRWLGSPVLPVALLQIAASALGVLLLYRITEACFGERAGFVAALLFALYAPAVHFDVLLLRGPWIALAALAVTAALIALRERPSAGRALALGLLTGAALLVNEGFLLLPPLVLATLAFAGPRGPRVLGAWAAGLVAALAPAMARNLAVGVAPWTLAATGSTVYAIFNTAGVDPAHFQVRPELFVPILQRSDGALLATATGCLHTFSGPGEIVGFYARRVLAALAPFENPDNVNFYYAAWLDPLLGWLPANGVALPLAAAGLGLAAMQPTRLVPLLPAALATWAPMLFTAPLSRYRAVAVVLTLPLAGLTAARAVDWIRARRLPALAGLAAALLLVAGAARVAESRVVFHGQPGDVMRYRTQEFWLAIRFHAAAGRLGAALDQARGLIEHNPDPAVRSAAHAVAADLQLQLGRREAALASLDAARALRSDDPAFLAQLAERYLVAFGDRERAAAVLREALAAHPGPQLEQAIEARLASIAGGGE